MEVAILEIIQALILMGVDEMRKRGKSEAEIKAWALKVNDTFNNLPSAKELPEVPQ